MLLTEESHVLSSGEMGQELCLVIISCHDTSSVETTRGVHPGSAALSLCLLLYSTKYLNFTLVTPAVSQSQTSFCRKPLVDMIIVPSKKKKKNWCRYMLLFFI